MIVAEAAEAVLAERLRRQGLERPVAKRSGYEALFRRLQPVSTGAYARPGSPPSLVHRTRFDDQAEADRLRGSRRIVKGRFQGGGVGYVHADDFATYANAFRRPIARVSETQERVFEALQYGGPLTGHQLREETELLSKQINPALQRLQEAFVVYEDQVDDDWGRAWYEFESEWPEIRLADALRDAAAAEVLARFLHAQVFATSEELRDWSRFPGRDLAKWLDNLVRERRVVRTEVDGMGEGFCCAGDERLRSRSPARRVFMLNKQDLLVRAAASGLRQRFGDRDILEYLLIDGRLAGAVCGHWGFKPYDVEDVVVELPAKQRSERRDEILAAVLATYHPPRHYVKHYAGRPLR